jgi:hypothetical protein
MKTGFDMDSSGSAENNRVALGLTFVAGAIALLSLTAWVAGGFRLRPEAGLEATMPPDSAMLILVLAAQFHLASRSRLERSMHWLRVGAVLICAVAALTSLLGHAMAVKGFAWSLRPGIPRMPPLAGGLLFLVSEGVLLTLQSGRASALVRTAGAVLAGTAWLAAVATGLVECLRHPLGLQAGTAAEALLCAVCVFLISTSLLAGAKVELEVLGLAPENAAVALLTRGLGPAFMLVASVQAALGAAARLPSPNIVNAMACGFALASYLGAAVAVLWLMLRQTTDYPGCAPSGLGAVSAQETKAKDLEPEVSHSLCRARTDDELHLAVCELLTEKLGMSLAWVAKVHPRPPSAQLLCYGGEPAGMFTTGSEPVRWEIQDPVRFWDFMQGSPWMTWDALNPPNIRLPWSEHANHGDYVRGTLLPIRCHGQPGHLLAVFDCERSPMSESLLAALRRTADTVACVMERIAGQGIRRDLETDLSACQLRLRNLATAVPGILYQLRVGADGVPRYTYISPKAAEFGLSTDPNHPDWRMGELIHPDDRNRFLDAVARCIMEREDFHFKGRALVAGQPIPFTAHSKLSVQGEELVFDGMVTAIGPNPPAGDFEPATATPG